MLRTYVVRFALEMTTSGKHGKPESRFSTFPTPLGNPFGIPNASAAEDILNADRA
jgi:hypothetical protein